MTLGAYRGGAKTMVGAGLAGVAGLLATLVGAFVDSAQAAFSYLTAYVFWFGIAATALLLLMAFHASHARWPVVLRRPLEAMALTLAPMVLLFAPIAVAIKPLFWWVTPSQEAVARTLEPELARELLERLASLTHWYLNTPFFFLRAALCLLAFAGFAWLLFRNSVRQDETKDLELTRSLRRTSGGGLPLLGLLFTFAAYDWIMSPNPSFFTQILGAYWFGGSMCSVLSLLILAGALGKAEDGFAPHMTRAHFHSLGKLLLAFVAFWAWMAYSQFMLTWIAHLPEDIPWLDVRFRGGWGVLSIILGAGQFVLPFFALLSKELKLHKISLGVVAVWNLAVHYVDIYWLVMPALKPRTAAPSIFDLTALVGIGGIALAFSTFALRGRFAIPVGDPYLRESLKYAK